MRIYAFLSYICALTLSQCTRKLINNKYYLNIKLTNNFYICSVLKNNINVSCET